MDDWFFEIFFIFILIIAILLPFIPCLTRKNPFLTNLQKRKHSSSDAVFQNIQEVIRELEAGKITEQEAEEFIREYEADQK